jgi:adenosine deaminase
MMNGPDRLLRLPKVELHRHLDGSVRIETLWEIAQEHGIDVGARTLSALRRKAVISSPMGDLESVLACFAAQQAVLCSFDALRRVTYENIEDAFFDGVRLIELRFAPSFIAQGKELDNDEIIAGVIEGMRCGMKVFPVEVGLIGILPRRFPHEVNAQATRDLIRWKKSGEPGSERICGFDLADAEADVDPGSFVPLVRQARDAGLGITIHSGENTSAAHVARTLETFQPDRIGHGIRCWGDAPLMQRLKDLGVLLEVSPTSNWITNAVPSLAEHPLPKLYKAGVPVCLNTDDPNLFGIDLVNEYEVCEREYGFGEQEFTAMNQAALRGSFLPKEITEPVAREL